MRHTLSILATVWLIAALLGTVFEKDLWNWMFLLGPAVKWGLIATGAIMALVFLRNSLPDRENRRSARAALAIAVSGLVLLVGFCDYLSQDVRFLLSRARYEQRLAEVLSGRGADDGELARIERGSSTQKVAFCWIGGVTDNWVGLVYDPTGEVSNADKARDLFGGQMTHSRHLTGPWYLCWFT